MPHPGATNNCTQSAMQHTGQGSPNRTVAACGCRHCGLHRGRAVVAASAASTLRDAPWWRPTAARATDWNPGNRRFGVKVGYSLKKGDTFRKGGYKPYLFQSVAFGRIALRGIDRVGRLDFIVITSSLVEVWGALPCTSWVHCRRSDTGRARGVDWRSMGAMPAQVAERV